MNSGIAVLIDKIPELEEEELEAELDKRREASRRPGEGQSFLQERNPAPQP